MYATVAKQYWNVLHIVFSVRIISVQDDAFQCRCKSSADCPWGDNQEVKGGLNTLPGACITWSIRADLSSARYSSTKEVQFFTSLEIFIGAYYVPYLFELRHLVPGPNFEGRLASFQKIKGPIFYIIGNIATTHIKDLDYEPRSPEH